MSLVRFRNWALTLSLDYSRLFLFLIFVFLRIIFPSVLVMFFNVESYPNQRYDIKDGGINRLEQFERLGLD